MNFDSCRPGTLVELEEREMFFLFTKSREIFLSESMLLELEAPIKVCGNIHGQYFDLLRLFDLGGFPSDTKYLFLGNYVNRGKQSIETICLLLALKLKYPQNIFLLRGNHDCQSVSKIHGCFDDFKRRYNIKLWKQLMNCFNCFPAAALINEKIFCVSGGLSPHLDSLDQIKQIVRPTDIPDQGLLCDLIWSDPDQHANGWEENGRGVSYCFNESIVTEFCKKHNLSLICRAHQVVEEGYEFFAKRQLVTIFSAPNFCGEFDNMGAIMSVNECLICSFQLLIPFEQENYKSCKLSCKEKYSSTWQPSSKGRQLM